MILLSWFVEWGGWSTGLIVRFTSRFGLCWIFWPALANGKLSTCTEKQNNKYNYQPTCTENKNIWYSGNCLFGSLCSVNHRLGVTLGPRWVVHLLNRHQLHVNKLCDQDGLSSSRCIRVNLPDDSLSRTYQLHVTRTIPDDRLAVDTKYDVEPSDGRSVNTVG